MHHNDAGDFVFYSKDDFESAVLDVIRNKLKLEADCTVMSAGDSNRTLAVELIVTYKNGDEFVLGDCFALIPPAIEE